MVSLLRLTHFIPQSASFIPFSMPVPAFCFINFKTRKKRKIIEKITISVVEFIFFIKLLFALIKKAISKTKMKR